MIVACCSRSLLLLHRSSVLLTTVFHSIISYLCVHYIHFNMHFSTIAAITSLLTTAFAQPHAHAHSHALEVRQTPSKPCSHMTGGIHVIVAPGNGTTQPPFGLLTTLSASILQAIPGSTNVSLPFNHSETNGVKQTAGGVSLIAHECRDCH